MATSRTVIVAGAGIGGLTAALALARQGFRAVVIEQSKRLEEIGAGIQLSPNASRVLLALGVGEALKSKVVAPDSLAIRSARSGREIVHMQLGKDAEFRFGAPYWMIHRADLQTVLLDAARDNPDVMLKLGTRVEDFAIHRNGVTAQTRKGATDGDERGIALVGATGLWSNLRQSLGDPRPAIFRRRTAWRAQAYAAQLRCHGPDRDPALAKLTSLQDQLQAAQPHGGAITREVEAIVRGCG